MARRMCLLPLLIKYVKTKKKSGVSIDQKDTTVGSIEEQETPNLEVCLLRRQVSPQLSPGLSNYVSAKDSQDLDNKWAE